MFKRANKITALLVAAASVLSIVPAMAADSTRLGTKDGTIESAIAFDGKYIYEGYKGDADKAVYFNGGEKDKELTDYEDYDFTTRTYGEKYIIAQDGNGDDNSYLVDLTNGSITEDTLGDKLDSTASKLEKALKKTDKYDATTIASTDLNEVASSAKFQEKWYSVNDTVKTNGNTIFTDASGKYVDASVLANIYAYSSTKGKIVKVEKFNKAYSDTGLTVALKTQPEVIAQDKDYLYAVVNVDITDGNGTAGTSEKYVITTGAGATVTIGNTVSSETDAAKLYSWIKGNLSSYTVAYDADTDKITAVAKVPGLAAAAAITGNGANVVRTAGTTGTNGTKVTNAWYLQKISKAQGDTDEEAFEPKSVTSYQIDNKSLYDDGDANDAYGWLIDSDKVADFVNVQVKDGSLYAYKLDDADTVKVFKLNLKQVKKDAIDTAVFGSTKLDGYVVEKDGDSDQDFENTNGNALSVDVNGVLWALHDGKIVKFDGKDKTTVYTCDSGFDQISVYDEKNLVAWSYDDERYTTVSEGTAQTQGEAAVVAPVAPVTGWVKNADGTWSWNDYAGAKVASKWINDKGTWYYLKADGIMATGWQQDGGVWYYLNPGSGAMATGWVNDNGTWYYLAGSGAMLANTTVDGYVLGANGAWVR